ncbi:ankyrin repeat domain-containing protein [Gordonia hankookensis]|uniref:Ankyrin repeat domain-containing protein n=1 Tax=Gordonia hankookensis TaxID=589403 RepID=A0ABR7WFL0_9ACTN|nr:ankyrin repeat domain-containing protein [Gordonia hankookensis]
MTGCPRQGGLDALHFAAQDDALDAARVLVEAGADVNAKDEHGNDPLSNAVLNNPAGTDRCFPIITFLLASGTGPETTQHRDAGRLSCAKLDLYPCRPAGARGGT